MGVQAQLSVPAGKPVRERGVVRMPFAFNLTTQPPLFTVTIKGLLLVKGGEEELNNVERSIKGGKPMPSVVQPLTSHTLFLAMLLARELGFPPALPLKPQQPPQAGAPL